VNLLLELSGLYHYYLKEGRKLKYSEKTPDDLFIRHLIPVWKFLAASVVRTTALPAAHSLLAVETGAKPLHHRSPAKNAKKKKPTVFCILPTGGLRKLTAQTQPGLSSMVGSSLMTGYCPPSLSDPSSLNLKHVSTDKERTSKEGSLRSVWKSSQTWHNAISLWPCYKPSGIVISFYRGKDAAS
jgi:hypothetical protein